MLELFASLVMPFLLVPALSPEGVEWAHRSAFVDVLPVSGLKSFRYSYGVSWADYDNDGDADLFIGGVTPKLWRNEGGTFSDATEKAGIGGIVGISTGVFGDYDNDGCVDLYLSGTQGRSFLFRNSCDGSFHDVTGPAGFREVLVRSYSGRGATWGDYDNDGYLDLYVTHWGDMEPDERYVSEPNLLYRNNGDGTFIELSASAGISGIAGCDFQISPAERLGSFLKWPFQPIWFDYNGDHLLDLYIANDGGASPLYRNDGDGTFTEVTAQAGLCKHMYAMGVAVADYDEDGDLDLYVTNDGANFLWRNNGDGTFTDTAAEAGVADHASVGWGAQFLDYDNDSDLDLYVANGTGETPPFPVPKKVPDEPFGELMQDRLFENDGSGHFTDVAPAKGITASFPKEGFATADYNNDGFIDLFVAGSRKFGTVENILYANTTKNGNRWLAVELVGTTSNRQGIGAKIYVTSGRKTQLRQVVSGESFLSQNHSLQIFGLGRSRRVQEVKILWPNGGQSILNNVPVNQRIIVREQ